MARRPTFPSSTASTTIRCSVLDRRCHVVMGRSGATRTIASSSSTSYVRSYAGLENAGRLIVTDTTRRCRLCGVMHMKHDLCCTDTLSWMPWNLRLVTTWWSCQPSGLMLSTQTRFSPQESFCTVSTILVGGCSWTLMLVSQHLPCRSFYLAEHFSHWIAQSVRDELPRTNEQRRWQLLGLPWNQVCRENPPGPKEQPVSSCGAKSTDLRKILSKNFREDLLLLMIIVSSITCDYEFWLHYT